MNAEPDFPPDQRDPDYLDENRQRRPKPTEEDIFREKPDVELPKPDLSVPFYYRHKRTAGIVLIGAGQLVEFVSPGVGNALSNLGMAVAGAGVIHAAKKNPKLGEETWSSTLLAIFKLILRQLKRSKQKA